MERRTLLRRAFAASSLALAAGLLGTCATVAPEARPAQESHYVKIDGAWTMDR